jgi:hypothetical protein
VAELAVGCTRLEKLVLRGCYLVTPLGLLRAISVLDLTSLDLGSNPNVDDLALKLLVPSLSHLSSLSLAGCVNVTGPYTGFLQLACKMHLTHVLPLSSQMGAWRS